MRCTILAGVAVMRTDSRTNAIRGMSVTPANIVQRISIYRLTSSGHNAGDYIPGRSKLVGS